MVEAYNLAGEILKGERETGLEINSIWEKSRFEKHRSVNGREFAYVMDHFVDCRLGWIICLPLLRG